MAFNNLSVFITAKLLPLFLAIVGFGLLIVVHELGHFLFCKVFNIHTPTFSIGFGKKIIEKKIGSTNFQIARIPFGGYVEISGLAEVGQGDQEHAQSQDETSFAAKPFWQKFFVLCGGIIFNLLFAYLVFCSLFMIGNSHPRITVTHIVKESPAQNAGLTLNDQLVSINNHSLIPSKQKRLSEIRESLLKEIKGNPGKKIMFTVKRKDKEIQVPITVGKNGMVGAAFSSPIEKLPFMQAISAGVSYTNFVIAKIANAIKSLFAKKSLEGAGGPVMIIAMTFKTAQSGLIPLFIFLAFMSINLALFNLLPLGITDGGQLVFATIEAIIRRPIPEVIRLAVNVVSIGLFLFLAIYLTYKDVATLFGKFFAGVYKKALLLFK